METSQQKHTWQTGRDQRIVSNTSGSYPSHPPPRVQVIHFAREGELDVWSRIKTFIICKILKKHKISKIGSLPKSGIGHYISCDLCSKIFFIRGFPIMCRCVFDPDIIHQLTEKEKIKCTPKK